MHWAVPAMKTSLKVTLISLAVAVPAFVLGAGGPVNQATHFWSKMWPFGGDAMSLTSPQGVQLPFFILLGVLEAATFGLAVSFLVVGRPLVRAVAGSSRGAQTALYVSGAWVLGNWWLHDSLHMTNSSDYWSLAVIEYGFHVTLMLAGATICWFLYKAWTMAQGESLKVKDGKGVVAIRTR